MISSVDKKAATQAYKATYRPIGVFLIRNLVNAKIFVGSALNLDAIFNRIRFQLYAGGHINKDLEADWKRYGTGSFEFEVLEKLEQNLADDHDYTIDVETLEDLWLEKLQPYGERGYNQPKKTREERLRMIASNRNL